MSLFQKRNTDLDLDCGCQACGVCEGTGVINELGTMVSCEACISLCKSKLCVNHAIDAGWINEKKQIRK